MLRFLTDELQAAEDLGQRVWIIGHVPAGYDGSNPIINPPNLFYSIVQRFAPATIAGIFLYVSQSIFANPSQWSQSPCALLDSCLKTNDLGPIQFVLQLSSVT